MREPAAAAAQRVGRPHHDRRAEGLDEAHPVLDALDHRALGHRLADAGHEVAEPATVLGRADGSQRSAEHRHAVAIQHAGVVERHRQVEPGLPAERRQERIGPMLLDDARQVRQRQRADEDRAADVGIGHDRRRVRVDQDGVHALGAQREAGLHAGVVELGGLADQDRSGADDEDPARSSHASARSSARSKTRDASIGPGAPSGWNWTDAIRPPTWRMPSTVASLRSRWLTDVACRGKRGTLHHGDLVVVRADVDPPGLDLDHRVVATVVADRQPPGLGVRRQCQQLVAEADAEDRRAARDGPCGEVADRCDLRRHPRRIARARRQDDEVRRDGVDVGGRGVGRQDHDLEATSGERREQRALHAVVDEGGARGPRAVWRDGRTACGWRPRRRDRPPPTATTAPAAATASASSRSWTDG